MTEADTKKVIKSALQSFSDGDLSQKSLKFYQALGYITERQDPFSEKTYRFFKESFLDGDTRFSEVKALVPEWKYIDLLFQLSKDEITPQHGLFDTKRVDRTIIETYLFFVIELSKDHYSRTALSQITRETNKVFPMPVMVLFKYGQTLTLAIINRRLHKRDERKDVLEKVTLIKDISIENPHRAHIEILFDLSFTELLRVHKFTNFVELHNAWQKTLDTKELNKRFYQELSYWYFWAMDHVSFPDDVEKNKDIRNATSLIRLITRIIFIWFIKEKDLVPEALFDRKELSRILKEFDKNNQSHSYYHAILQNLFFGTLNQKMNERSFAKEGSFEENRTNYGVKNLFRYANHFAVSEKEALALFKDIPFLNGGLFDCLDKENDEGKVLYSDGFSRNPKKQAVVPDFLFFGAEEEYDLSAVFGTKNKRYKVKGLINILSGYKFTVAENTPVEEEVALDPELLGKVFENLLASYNPETQTTARKQTGSFYTPREIVDYMVDESLKAYLKQALSDKLSIKAEDADTGLEILFSYTEREHAFTNDETKVLIQAIDSCKILDPACGSGAFPMGILHKLVHILHKLDAKNEQWKERQIQKARQIDDPSIRDHLIADIESAFENNELDYGRKLYLIENCIFGVDIQPIAGQIAKLRFFISLVVDQNKQPGKENLGIRSLPNMETKFVAANTLIGLDKPKQMLIQNPQIKKLEDELKDLRHKYFSAKTRKEKLDCQRKDKELRKRISTLLIKDGWDNKSARQVAAFDPYDQNASSPFFEPEWMFGILDGFDVLIANPPYGGNIDAILSVLKPRYQEVIQNYAESFKMFFQVGLELAASKGVLTYISPNVFLSQPRYKDLRKYLLRYRIMRLVNLGENVFEQVVPVCLSFIANERPGITYQFADLTDSNKFRGDFTSVHYNEVSTARVASFKDFSLYYADALKDGQVYFDDALEIKDAGIQYHRSGIGLKNKGGNDLYERLFSSSQKQFPRCKPVWYGRLINRYWIDDRTDEFFNLEYESILKDNESVSFTRDAFATTPKILWRQTASRLQATIDFENHWFRNTIQCAYVKKDYQSRIDPHYLLGVVNSKYIAFTYNKLVREAGRVFPQVKITHVKKLPLAIPPKQQQEEIAKKVKTVLAAKHRNPSADTRALEREIDQRVYTFYGLTEEEITIVEG